MTRPLTVLVPSDDSSSAMSYMHSELCELV
jgi:hypothetical protein